MSESHFDPEVLALLDEIARSPEGRLLHVPRQKLPAYFGDPKETLTPHGSSLSKAERHLITAYREEAARVLLEACILRLKEDPQVLTTLKGDERDLQRKARFLSSRITDEPDPLRTLNAVGEGSSLSVTELAVTSVRLAPCDLAFNALALCYQKERWYWSSLRALERFYDGAVSRYQRAQAFANMGRAHALQLDFRRAFELCWQAFVLDSRAEFATWCLADAIQGGHEESALMSAKGLDECEADAEFAQVMTGIREGRTSGAWAPTHASKQMLVKVRSAMSARSGAICDAFS